MEVDTQHVSEVVNRVALSETVSLIAKALSYGNEVYELAQETRRKIAAENEAAARSLGLESFRSSVSPATTPRFQVVFSSGLRGAVFVGGFLALSVLFASKWRPRVDTGWWRPKRGEFLTPAQRACAS